MDRIKLYQRSGGSDCRGAMIGESTMTPQIRVRIAHAHTLKDGWRLDATTVEYSGTEINWVVIADELRKAHELGAQEAHCRNLGVGAQS